jgi:hypothetical protein
MIDGADRERDMTSDAHWHLVFNIVGTNRFGASTGRLTLYQARRALLVSEAFSGGLSSPARATPIPPERYHINLRQKGVASSSRDLIAIPGSGYFQLHHWWGIERIDIADAQVEWGHYRAALNPPRRNMAMPYRGNFLHGKLRPGDYTHGCICERSEQILRCLWTLPPRVLTLQVRT